jgi:hypothetical protein
LRQATLAQIELRLGPALAPQTLQKPGSGDHSRERIFTLPCTFWCWIWQVLQRNTSCREVVRQVQALLALESLPPVAAGTSAFCQARGKLPLSLLAAAFAASARSAENRATPGTLLQGRPIKVADGTTLRLPDTPPNRKAYPPAKHQFASPGFPLLKMVAIFALASGAILARATGDQHSHELRLLLSLRAACQPEDVLVADRAYGCYLLAAWLKGLRVDLIARLATRQRPVDFRKAHQRLGPQDGLFIWRKPFYPSPLLDTEDWAALPEEITVRVIHVRLPRSGFRTRELTVATTLLDAQLYPATQIIATYLKRWRLELCLDDLKTTLGMERLSCRTPALAAKEVLVFLTAHNLLRWIMAQAAQAGGVDLERLSFKGTLDALRQWTLVLAQVHGPHQQAKKAQLWRKLLTTLAADLVPLRPERHEPRAVKKRSKYPHLSKPRHQYVERWSRNQRRRLATAKRKASLN